MKKTKSTLLSMLVISIVFCFTALFNIQLPFYSVKESDTSADGSKETAGIHSLSYNVDRAEVFNVNQYLSPAEAKLAQDETTEEPSAAPTTVPEETSEDLTMALAMDASADEIPADDPDTAAADTETIAETEAPEDAPVIVEAKYADIGISIAKEFVNIRKEPSTDGKVLGKLYRNSACTIISEEDGWYYVESGSVTGYAKAEFIKTGIPDDELIAKYAKLKISVTADGLNVRQEPSQDSKKLTCVYKNERFPVLEKIGEWTKVHIEDENLDGYVKNDYAKELVTFENAVSKAEEDKILALKAEARAKAETEVKYGDGYSYTEADLKLLACLVHAEAGDQCYEGKLAVANIVLNRVKSSKYPDTIKAVIYQPGQFSVARSGSLQKQLDNFDHYDSKSQKLSIKAAREALEGANNIGKRLYFHTYAAAAKKGYNNKKDSVKIDDHLYW